MTEMPVYATGLLVTAILCALSWWKVRDGAIVRSMVTVAGIWVAGASYVAETGIYDPWQLSIALDVMAATIILRHPAGVYQALLGVLFILQIAMHIGYAGAKWQGGGNPYLYYDAVTYAAWVQLLVLSGWASERLSENWLRRVWRRGAPPPRRAHNHHRVEGEE